MAPRMWRGAREAGTIARLRDDWRHYRAQPRPFVDSRTDVDRVMKQAEIAGVSIVNPFRAQRRSNNSERPGSSKFVPAMMVRSPPLLSTLPLAVSTMTDHSSLPSGGRQKSTGSTWPLSSRKRSSSTRRLPSASTSVNALPPRRMAIARAHPSSHSSSVIGCPSGRNQARSSTDEPRILRPEEAGAAETGMGVAQRDQVASELEEGTRTPIEVPVDPADLIVLGVDVVVPPLRAADLIAMRQHRHSLREEERCHQIALGLLAGGDDLGVLARSLHAMVPRHIVIVTIPVVLAVGLVVLLVVADQILEGKPVMGGDEVDAGVGTAAVSLIKVG